MIKTNDQDEDQVHRGQRSHGDLLGGATWADAQITRCIWFQPDGGKDLVLLRRESRTDPVGERVRATAGSVTRLAGRLSRLPIRGVHRSPVAADAHRIA